MHATSNEADKITSLEETFNASLGFLFDSASGLDAELS
jgi:hypothetical protein